MPSCSAETSTRAQCSHGASAQPHPYRQNRMSALLLDTGCNLRRCRRAPGNRYPHPLPRRYAPADARRDNRWRRLAVHARIFRPLKMRIFGYRHARGGRFIAPSGIVLVSCTIASHILRSVCRSKKSCRWIVHPYCSTAVCILMALSESPPSSRKLSFGPTAFVLRTRARYLRHLLSRYCPWARQAHRGA